MQYMLLIYEDETTYGPNRDGSVMSEMGARHQAFMGELGAARVAGAGLKSAATATTVRRVNGSQTIHDGAFAETKEQLGGFYLIDVPDLDAAIAFARKLPLRKDGAVEIRPALTGG